MFLRGLKSITVSSLLFGICPKFGLIYSPFTEYRSVLYVYTYIRMVKCLSNNTKSEYKIFFVKIS